MIPKGVGVFALRSKSMERFSLSSLKSALSELISTGPSSTSVSDKHKPNTEPKPKTDSKPNAKPNSKAKPNPENVKNVLYSVEKEGVKTHSFKLTREEALPIVPGPLSIKYQINSDIESDTEITYYCNCGILKESDCKKIAGHIVGCSIGIYTYRTNDDSGYKFIDLKTGIERSQSIK